MLNFKYVNMYKHKSFFTNKVFIYLNEYILGPYQPYKVK